MLILHCFSCENKGNTLRHVLLPDGHTYKNVGLSISELPQDLRLLITYVKSVKKHPPDRFND